MAMAMETGKQPCERFDPGSGSESMYNWHECPGCPGQRRFCSNCHRDHHEDGWDTCARAPKCPNCDGDGCVLCDPKDLLPTPPADGVE